jgi:hypothetical protein
MIRVLENPFYYLENFQLVLAWLDQRYADLLNEEEQRFIAGFPALPQASRALFTRMVMRKGCLFRAHKLNYDEIGDTAAAAMELLPTGWVRSDPPLTIAQLFDLLQKPEIALLFHLSAAEKSLRKQDQLDLLQARYPEARPFSDWCSLATGQAHAALAAEQVYEILNKELCERLRLMFFGNFRQDWSEFVLSDLGIYQYEKVEFTPASRGFRERRDIDDYLALHRCRELFREREAADPADDILGQLRSTMLENDWLASRRDKLLFQVGQHIERQQDWDTAFSIYAGCGYPGARVRSIRVLEKRGDIALAYQRLSEAERACESEAERQHLQRIAPRLRRKLGLARGAAKATSPVERLDVCVPVPAGPWHVEGVVRDHLAHEDAPVFYVENTLINSLFGLLCWNAVFKPLPGAFFHPFHRGPADLHSADFQRRRAAEFNACLGQLETTAYRDTILRNYSAKRGIQSPFVSWEILDPGLLALALDCIPATHMRKWFDRMLADLQSNCTGFPDLIQFWPAEKRYNMIEVKGPGDRLQDNQKRWIDYCAQHGMPVTVCYLQWLEAAA